MPRVKKVDVDVKDVVKKVNQKTSKTLKETMLKEENKKASAKKAVKTKLEKAAKEEVVVKKANKKASEKIKETMIKEDNKKDIKKQLEEAAEKEAKKKEAARKRAETIARKKAEKEAAEEEAKKKEAARKRAETIARKKAEKEAAEKEAKKKEAARKRAETMARKKAEKEAAKKENEEKTVEEKVSPYANDPRYNDTKSTNEVGRSLGWEIKKTEEPIIDEVLPVEEESEPDLEVIDYLEENEPIEYTEFDKDGNKTENVVEPEEIENDTLPDVSDEIDVEESKESVINSIKNSQEILAQVKSLENEVVKEKKEIEDRDDR